MGHKKNAFTLVELLIVIIIVVILSTMVMLAGGESQAAAKATKIVSALTNLKIFALNWYKDNSDKVDKNGKINGTDLKTYFSSSDGQDKIRKFFVGDVTIGNSGGCYEILDKNNNEGKPAWYVCYHLKSDSEHAKIKAKLEDKARESQNLFQESEGKLKTYTNGSVVYIHVITFNY
ncbi:MAG: prepilin-type N-terminal cleavage/methylation domain-containing protein [Synergistaceae bacterium]|nr:prepilin-type N-terminal cleavage/methylation domain-containing protein [Synergistaceae bacterium]